MHSVTPILRSPFLVAALAVFLGGCATNEKPVSKPFFNTLSNGFSFGKLWPGKLVPKLGSKRAWDEQGAAGAPHIEIALGEQRAYFFRGKHLVGQTDISSGRDGYDTPPGHYRVIQKDKDHRSTLYGQFVTESGEVVNANADLTKQRPPAGTTFVGAKMPFFLRFQDGYGLHAGHLPGHRASHGCVRLPMEMAEHFFHAAEVGTPVVVTDR